MADSKDLEKPAPALRETGSDIVQDVDFTPEEQRKIMHKIDRRLIPVTGIMYCVSLIDRVNLANAAIAGCVWPLRSYE